MNESELALWNRLLAFSIDQPDDHFPFTTRLARENGWSREFTERAVAEYKRFLFLAVSAGHMITPSEEVDQVWHLHMIYTRSYWHELCGKVLQQPLHHEPTKGGLVEKDKFVGCYEQTLASYERFFGQVAPADLWPAPEIRFAPHHHRLVDVSRFWLLPRPAFTRRFHIPRHAASYVASGLLASLFLVSCQDLLDWRGPEFLIFYGSGLFVALIVSWLWVRWNGLRHQSTMANRPLKDTHEIAFLSGGPTRAFDATLASLFARGLIQCGQATGQPSITRIDAPAPGDLSPVERKLLETLPVGKPVPLKEARQSLKATLDKTNDELVRLGYWLSKESLGKLRWRASLPFLCLLAIGGAKIATGISRHKPVAFLFVLMLVTIVIMIIRLCRMPSRTVEGDRHWGKIKRELPRHPVAVDPTANQPAAAGDVGLMVAFGGIAMLTMPGFEPLRQTVQPPSSGADSGGADTSSCSGGSDGGSSGCGGCGGGGD